MFSPRVSLALHAAFYCFIAQLFLSLAAIVIGGAVLAALEFDLAVLVFIPVGWFAIYVGGQALHRARALVDGPGPSF
jgi:hypothetical protein